MTQSVEPKAYKMEKDKMKMNKTLATLKSENLLQI